MWTSSITHWSFVLFLTPLAQPHTTDLILSWTTCPVVCKKNNSYSWENWCTPAGTVGAPHVELWIESDLYFFPLLSYFRCYHFLLYLLIVYVPKFFVVKTLGPGKVIKMGFWECSLLQMAWILCLQIFKQWIN